MCKVSMEAMLSYKSLNKQKFTEKEEEMKQRRVTSNGLKNQEKARGTLYNKVTAFMQFMCKSLLDFLPICVCTGG